MANLISLAAYGVKVWNPGDKDSEILSDFDEDGSDLLDFLNAILTGIQSKTLDQTELQQAISVLKLERIGRKLSGIVETGQYGYESNLIDVKTAAVVYKRKKGDAEMLPFYFYLEIPEGTHDGILILQRTATFGIRKILYWIFKMAFMDKHPEFILRLYPLIMQSEIDKFVKGKIQKINFIRKSIPADLADAYDAGHKEVRGTMELVVRASRGGFLPLNKFVAKIFQTKETNGVFALEDDQEFAYDNVKAKVKVGQSVRTINAGDPGRLRSYYDINDVVKIGSDGHPDYQSMQEEARKLATKIRAAYFDTGAT